MAEPYQHAPDPDKPGKPCRRCGLKYSMKTAYVPCFEPGDTFETWKARQHPEVQALLPQTAAEE